MHSTFEKKNNLVPFEIFSFLSANFKPTLTIKDRMGRTPFHYAAICNDGGVFYDLLKQHGADSSIVDSVSFKKFVKRVT